MTITILDIVFYICTDSVCSFRMSGFGTIRGGKRQKDKHDSQWEYWKDNRGLKLMKKQKWKPGMGLGDGHGRSGREWGLKGEWVKKSSPEAVNALSLPSVSPHLLPSLLHLLHSTCHPLPFSPGPIAFPLLLASLQIVIHLATQTRTHFQILTLAFIPPRLGKGWGQRFPEETPDRWDLQSQLQCS